MPIHENDLNTGNLNSNAYEQQGPKVEQKDDTQQPRQSIPFSFHGGGLFGSPIGRGLGSEIYSKLKVKLFEIYKQTTNKNVEITIIDLDNINEPALVYSCLIVAMRYKDSPALGISYHTLLLEDTGEPLNPVMDNINGQQIEILKVTSDAFDAVLLKKAYDKVASAFNTTNIHPVDGCVIPREFNIEDNRAVYSIALNAGLACGTDLESRIDGFADFNLADVRSESTLNVNVTFSKRQLLDSVGSMMRSDVLINFDSRKNTANNRAGSVNSGDKEAKISELSGFIDLVWLDNQQNNFNAFMSQQQQFTQKYAARLIITNLVSSHIYTLSSILLALSTAVSVRDDNNWIQAFKPIASSNKEIDTGDIGAINIEANLMKEASGYGTRIDTKTDNFRLEDLGQLVASLIKPGLIFSIDCPEVGPQSWYLSVFAAASMGSNEAYMAIYNSANQLTNGFFSKNFEVGTPMFVDVGNRVHNGYYIDKDGMRKDIRNIDHLAVCNLVGDRNPQFIRDWSDTFLKTQYPLPMRLAQRKRMIQALTQETAVFTGFSQRVTLTNAFMNALVKSIAEVGLDVRITTPLSGSDITSVRGTATFANSALMQPGNSFMSPGGLNWTPPNMGTAFGSRWGF